MKGIVVKLVTPGHFNLWLLVRFYNCGKKIVKILNGLKSHSDKFEIYLPNLEEENLNRTLMFVFC